MTDCPKCGQLAERQISLVPIIFKGSGWYVNDHGKKKSTLGNGDTPSTSSDDGHGHSHDDIPTPTAMTTTATPTTTALPPPAPVRVLRLGQLASHAGPAPAGVLRLLTVDGQQYGSIGVGFVVLLGVTEGDSVDDARHLVDKTVNLRVFPDDEGRFNRSLLEVDGSLMVVSQFTLYADTRKGRAPASCVPPNPKSRSRSMSKRITLPQTRAPRW